ncbi:MAG: 3-dehydroquinate synthase [Clostridia bacterium]|nr:3-dehydroquinate synthase [Clostridia bacterium]
MSHFESATPSSVVRVSLPSKPPFGYDIPIGRGLRHCAGEMIAAVHKPCRALLLTDDTVEVLYADDVTASLAKIGFSVVRHVVPHGEASKSAGTLFSLLEAMAKEHMTRSDLLIALGGGVVGDLGGFASAVYQRGIPFVQIPTTLLAMVDASVGGKTAIDLEAGKNLVGAFHQPSLVICDPDCLSTLPANVFSDGMAEVIKYAFINDKVLFEALLREVHDCMEEIIRLCVEDKRALVETDETDVGARQLLNLGHTVGHAIEACSDFTISHGSAVAEGMVIITRAAVKMGICEAKTLSSLVALLVKYGLPTECPFTAEQLYAVALSDKKRAGGTITLVVPFGVADSRLVTVPVDALEGYIRAGLAED